MIKGYYFITDSGISRKGNVSDVKNAVRAGVKVIQYRNKNIDSGVLYREALKLRKIVKKAVFLINDRADIALAVGADGVHVGQSDLPYEKARKILEKIRLLALPRIMSKRQWLQSAQELIIWAFHRFSPQGQKKTQALLQVLIL